MLNAFLSVAVPLVFFGLLGHRSGTSTLDFAACWAIAHVGKDDWARLSPGCARRCHRGNGNVRESDTGGVYLVGGYVFAFYLFPSADAIGVARSALPADDITPRAWRTGTWHSRCGDGLGLINGQHLCRSRASHPPCGTEGPGIDCSHHRCPPLGITVAARTSKRLSQRQTSCVPTGSSLLATWWNRISPSSRMFWRRYRDWSRPHFVNGNHENYTDPARVFKLVAAQGVRVLRNERRGGWFAPHWPGLPER